MNKPALLALEDGSIFDGIAIGVDGSSVGEVVFNTAMTGYQEILTDPSYAKQIVTLTYPHIGSVGINSDDNESHRAWVAGLVIRDLPLLHSNWRSEMSLTEFLVQQQILAIANVDTRRLTQVLRDKGALRGCITTNVNDPDAAIAQAQAFPGLQGLDLAREVTTPEVYTWDERSWVFNENERTTTPKDYHVVVYDFGVKRNILRLLADRVSKITVVPATTSAADVLALKPQGVLLSNGPGDPQPCDYAIAAIKQLLEAKMPLFGICLGHQLLSIALGGQSEKMKFGHHGANHPVQEINSGRVFITSQNHGFAVAESSLPDDVAVTHRSLFDGSLQGIRSTKYPAFSFQGHPEASPGPMDIIDLFDDFLAILE